MISNFLFQTNKKKIKTQINVGIIKIKSQTNSSVWENI